MLKTFLLLTILFGSSALMTACNTTEGAGKDIKHAGEKIEDTADRNK